MAQLLSLMKRDVRVESLTIADRDTHSDALRAFRELVLESRDSYPGIDRWLDHRVLAELGTGSRRVALLAYERTTPVAAAVLKAGDRAKICHLRIAREHEGTLLGDLLFSLMIAQAAPMADSIHFTLPESLWERRGCFFQSFGFIRANPSLRQYRGNDPELACTADLANVWQAVTGKLPRLAQAFSIAGSEVKPSLMLSIHPRFAELILEGRKRVEIRTRFSPRWAGHRVSIYATSPVRSLVGEADITRVRSGSPSSIWGEYGTTIGCEQDKFDAYTHDRDEIYALELGNVLPYATRVPFAELQPERVSPPQAYCRLLEGAPLTRAAMMASLVHGTSVWR